MSDSGILITEVRVRNFRCLRAINVTLDNLTVVIGENNSGKSSFLDALYAAIGASQRSLTEEDIFVKPKETGPPKDRVITIDILIHPAEGNKIIEKFPGDSYWLGLWGIGIAQDDEDNDIVPIRVQMKWNAVKGEYVTERRFLNDWQTDPDKWELSKFNEKATHISAVQVEPFSLNYIDAKRDIQEDLRSRGSFWHKMVSDPGLSDPDVKRIEETLSELNESIISSSEVLSHVQEHLNELYHTVACQKDSVSIAPIARHIRDLSRGMDVLFSTKDAPSFPISRHGMGTRSLSAILIFKAYVTWKQKKAKDRIHPMLALEEPEGHLHPQAQRALFQQIGDIPGQRIITTHSPHICSQASISQFRHFRKAGEEAVVSRMDLTGGAALSTEDLRKINRMVLRTRGDMLFARALVFFEGETEEQALPIFAEQYWKRHPNELGIDFIGVGGRGNYLPFLRLASSFGIPWYLFSDGEKDAISSVDLALKAIGEPEHSKNDRVIVIPGGKDFEEYLVAPDYKNCFIDMVVQFKTQGPKEREELKKKWEAKGLTDLLGEISSHKTQYGPLIAKAITGLTNDKLRFPVCIKALFDKMSLELNLPLRDTSKP